MRHINFALICLTIFTFSCKKINSKYFIEEGRYIGTFQRENSTGGQLSNVTITFSENNWAGQGQFPHYPALCRGTYKENGADTITFNNACPWTAEFDWSLILGGDYKINIKGNNIEIFRDYNSGYKDIYKLTKQ